MSLYYQPRTVSRNQWVTVVNIVNVGGKYNFGVLGLKKYQKGRAAIETERMKVEAVRRTIREVPALDRLLRYETSLELAPGLTLSRCTS